MSDDAFSDADRAALDGWLQQVRSDRSTNALFEALRLQTKHELAGIRAGILGYQALLDEADRQRDQVADVLRRITPLVGRVAILEAQIAQSGIDREQMRAHLRALAHYVAELQDQDQAASSGRDGS